MRTIKFTSVLLLIFTLSIAHGQSPVEIHGKLSVLGTKIVNEQGLVVSFSGNSFFWSNTGWEGGKFYKKEVVAWLKEDWKSTIVRAALGADASGSYLTDVSNKDRVKAVVDGAIEEGLYVIIDWHSHHAEDHPEEAVAFFSEMATLYGDKPNVIYEIYNEPLNISWSTKLKPYLETVIAAIRETDPDNLIIVGTPNWSQDVDVASQNPITGYINIAYSLHFYAGTHGTQLRSKASTAIENGIALVVTEWGTVNSDGKGGVAEASTNEWKTFMAENHITNLNWSVCDKNEGASIVKPGASTSGGWTDSQLTASGLFVRTLIRNWQVTDVESPLQTPKSPVSSVFPIPFKDEFKVIFTSDNSVKNVKLLNLKGQVIREYAGLNGSELLIQLTAPAERVYLLQVEDQRGKIFISKLVKGVGQILD